MFCVVYVKCIKCIMIHKQTRLKFHKTFPHSSKITSKTRSREFKAGQDKKLRVLHSCIQ